jgi:hypothetical protein
MEKTQARDTSLAGFWAEFGQAHYFQPKKIN